MAEKSEKRRIYIYVNGKQVENNLRSLTSSSRKLRNEIAGLTPGTRKFIAATKNLRKVNGRIKSIRKDVSGLGGAFGSLKRGIGSNLFAMVGWGAAISGAISIVRGAYKTISDFDESVADLAKTTNLSKEAARGLAKEVIKIDTRSSVTSLLELATSAGRLGLKGKDVVEFTKAADMAFVSLGDSIDGSAEDISLTLGKLAGNFNLEKKYGIGDAINRIGSVLNDLGAKTKATEGPIIDFTQRLAGVAAQANISLPDIAALGALFDESGQSMEVAATTMNKLLPAIGKDVTRFAGIAGVSVSKFKKLVENDAMAALKLIAEGAKSNQKGLIGLTETLQSYGISNARAASIVGIFTSKIERLTQIQGFSSNAMVKGTSLSNEFALKTETLNAETDKFSANYDKMIISLDNGNGFFSKTIGYVFGLGNELVKYITIFNNTGSAYEKFIQIGTNAAVTIGTMSDKQAKLANKVAKHEANLNKYKDALIILKDRVKDGIITQEQYAEAVKKVGEGWDYVKNKSTTSINTTILKTKEELAAEKEAAVGKKKIRDKAAADAKKMQMRSKEEKMKSMLEEEKVIDDTASFRIEAIKKQIKDESKKEQEILKIQRKAASDKIMLIQKMGIKKEDLNKEDLAKLEEFAGRELETKLLLEKVKEAEIAQKKLASNKEIQDEINAYNRANFEDQRVAKIKDLEDEFKARLEKVKGNGEVEKNLRIQINQQKKDAIDAQNAIFKEEDDQNSLEARQQDLENKLVIVGNNLENRRAVLEELRALELEQVNLTGAERVAINKKYDEIEKQEFIDAQTAKLNVLKKVTSMVSAVINTSSRRKLKRFDRDRKKELENFTGTAEEKATLNKKFDNQREKIERDNFEKKKITSLATAAIDTALSVLKASAVGPPANIPLMILAGIAGAIQIGIIASQKFNKGGYTGDGYGAPDESGYKIAGYVHQDEWVAPEWMTRNPMYADTIGMLETARKSKAGYSDGGNVSATVSTVDIPNVVNSSTAGLENAINTLNQHLASGIVATAIIDQNNMIDLKEGIDEISAKQQLIN